MEPWSPASFQHEAYSALTRRIQSVITSQKAQVEHQAYISREPDESRHHWEQLLGEISEAEGVTLTRREDGSAHIAWFVACH